MLGFLDSKEKKAQLFISYVVFLLNGMLALSIGSLLPFVRDSNGLDYAFCGILVSLHSFSNLMAGFAAGALPLALGRKKSILIFNSFYFISFALLIFGSGKVCIALAFFMTGLARGASSNFNNTTINNLAPGKIAILNGLHAMFSIGAFLFPVFLMVLTSANAANWVYACYVMAAMGILSFILYAIIPVSENKVEKKEKEKVDLSFFKEHLFLLCTGTLFFYLCAEQAVIGWLITYFEDTGLLSSTLSQLMASVLWIMILAGRLCTAWLSTKLKRERLYLLMGLGIVVFFLLLITSRNVELIVIGIMGFGFSMAGIYPTTVSFAGNIIKEYKMAWSFMLTIASMGSILMPSIIGKIAENAGIFYGMASVIVVVVIDMLFMLRLTFYLKSQKEMK